MDLSHTGRRAFPPYPATVLFLRLAQLTETQSTVPDDAFDLEPGKTFRNALALEEAQAAAEAATSAEPAAAAA